MPVPCSFYDELEAIVTLRKEVKIVYQEETKVQTIVSKVKDLQYVDKIEFLILPVDRKIRLDAIKEIDGKNPGMYC